MPALNIVGDRFGRLVVVSRSGSNRHGQSMWNCICDCGKSKVVNVGALRRGGTKSCGCSISDRAGVSWMVGFGNRARPIREAKIRELFLQCKKGAQNRGHEFSISEDEFLAVSSRCCNYCGLPPQESTYRTGTSKNRKRVGSGLFVNGIDRVDNSIGYVVGNMVPCCIQCNKAKGTMGVSEFLGMIFRQSKFQLNKSKETYMGLDTQDVSYREAA